MDDAKKLKLAGNIMKRAQTFNTRMENICKTDPWVTIQLRSGDDAEIFKLEFSYGAVRKLFRATGKNLNNGEIDMTELSDMDFMCEVLAAGLSTHHPELEDTEKVASLVSMRHRVYYAHRIALAMQATQPELEDLNEIMADLDALKDDESAGPLPEIVPSPTSGQPA